MNKSTKHILITDVSVARLAAAKTEAGYVVRDRDVRGFIVKIGMRRKTYRYEGEQRNGKHRNVISRKLGELACTRFRRHRVRCFTGTGGGSWRGGSLRGSSSLRRYG